MSHQDNAAPQSSGPASPGQPLPSPSGHADGTHPLSPITPAERDRLLYAWNDTGAEFPRAACIHTLFEAQVRRSPDAVALIAGEHSITYQELNRRANWLACHLREQGVGPEVLVGVCLERSAALVIGLLAILKAGGAYVPLDPAYPPDRIAMILADSAAPVVITQQRLRALAGAGHATSVCLDSAWDWPEDTGDRTPVALAPENLAYLIYTSGSTGRPKGVAITHRNAVAMLSWAAQTFVHADLAGVLASTSICFDLSVYELFLPLSLGGTVILADNALALPRLPARAAVTLVNTVPSAMAELIRAGGLPDSVRTVNLAGEPLKRVLAQQVYARPNVRRVYNLYGPSEDTTYSTFVLVDRDDPREPTIGRPISNSQVYILDERLEPVPVGAVGELYMGGEGITRGYLGRPELTAERFIPNPFAEQRLEIRDWRLSESGPPISNLQSLISTGTRLYKTGDLARYRPDRQIEYLGRIDHQVKIRGFRIELGEIEAVLSRHPAVESVVVVARQQEESGERRLVAYLVPTTDDPFDATQGRRPPTTDSVEDGGWKIENGILDPSEKRSAILNPPSSISGELRAYLKERLPDYMIPSAFVFMIAMPLTPNGKINRQALPAPGQERPELASEFVAPGTPTERALAAIWEEVLGLTGVGIHDHFFALGGHSLLAARVLARVGQRLHVTLAPEIMFEHPTIAGLAGQVEAAPPDTAELPALAPVARAGERGQALPAWVGQQQVWFFDRLLPGSPLYHVPVHFQVAGALDTAALERTLTEVVRRHESLHTAFVEQGDGPIQVIRPPKPIRLEYVDLRALPAEARPAARAQIMAEHARRPFEIGRPPLLRALLVQAEQELYHLLVTVHHIAFDGWSTDVLMRELAALYPACTAGKALPPVPALQYADFAVWQNQLIQGAYLERLMAYWAKQFAGAPPLLALPADRPRPAVQSYKGARLVRPIAGALLDDLEHLGHQEGASLFMVLLAAFQTLLQRYSGQTDLSVSTPVAGRSRPELDDLIGFFVNTLVLRTDLAGNPTFLELIGRVRRVALGAYAHQDLPFELLIRGLELARDLSYNPLSQVMLAVQNIAPRPIALPDLRITYIEELDTGTAKYDLTLFVEFPEHGPVLTLEYNTDLFDAATGVRLMGHFETLLAGIVARSSARLAELPLLSAAERRHLLLETNATARPLPDRCAHLLIAAQAQRSPDAIALSWGEHHLTYQALHQRAFQLAHHLCSLGVNSEDLIGICMERSPEMLIALLAVLHAGAAYLPLDPALPPARLDFLLTDAGPAVLLTSTTDHPFDFAQGRRPPTTASDQPALTHPLTRSPAHPLTTAVDLRRDWPTITRQPATPPAVSISPDQLCYTIYTSGSTGTPKGVQVCHAALVNFLTSMCEQPGLSADDVLVAVTTLSFDIAGLELFGPLLAGAKVVLASREQALDGQALRGLLEREHATLLQATPATWRLLLAAGWDSSQHLRALCGGEALPAALAAELLDHTAELWNLYGPTETTIWSSLQQVTSDTLGQTAVPIGRGLANTQLYVLDRHLQPVPIGVVGELYIGGAGLARGYAKRPDLTAERFVPNPFSTTTPSTSLRAGDDPFDFAAPEPACPERRRRVEGQGRRRPTTENRPAWVENRRLKIEDGSVDASEMRSSILYPPSSDGVGGPSSVVGERLYRTGDQVRYRSDGLLEYVGRGDGQIKLRGFRIELGEIEALLEQHEVVQKAVVLLREDMPGDKRLVAYLLPTTPSTSLRAGDHRPPTTDSFDKVTRRQEPVLSGVKDDKVMESEDTFTLSPVYPFTVSGSSVVGGQSSVVAELRAFLKTRLPEYMLPSAFVVLDALPLTPNGKIDRRALPAPDQAEPALNAAYLPPRDEAERTIASVWQQVLGVAQVGARDNFFDLGGHSLLLVQVHDRLRSLLGVDLSVIDLFKHPTVEALAGFVSQEHRPATAPVQQRGAALAHDDIAVVGISCRFPKARKVDQFWQNLRDGVEAMTAFSDEELLAAGEDPALLRDPGYVKAGTILDDIDLFDAVFFGFTPREAEIMDPQHRLFLESAWEALEHAGYDSEQYKGRIGVYAGAGLSSYLIDNLLTHRDLAASVGDIQVLWNNDKDFIPTQVSYKMNLTGPSINVNTACSTSLVAVHLARQGLLNDECDMALAGGVTVYAEQTRGYVYQEGGIQSPDGNCRPFDAEARGTITSSGVGIVVLKRLSDALADGDCIYAVIKGSAINNDGAMKVGYTAPGVDGQAAVIARAQAVAGVAPETITYVETHGTGTPLGDPIEVAALTQAFRAGTDRRQFCAIGSVKSNIGHTDRAAGAAGLIKTVLALKHRVILASLHFGAPNPQIDFAASPFYVNTSLRPWPAGEGPRRAGVSSFGIGGTNAHVILEEAPPLVAGGPARPQQLLLLSARTEAALESVTDNLAAHLRQHPDSDLADVAHTLQVGRRAFGRRRMLLCRDLPDALAVLETRDPRRLLNQAPESAARSVVFLFPGQGAQYESMGRSLYQHEAVFRETIDRCCELLEPHLGRDLRDLLYPDNGRPTTDDQQPTTEGGHGGQWSVVGGRELDQTQYAQPALFVVEYALAQLWMAWGVRPSAMIGHSIGELVAACLAGVFSLEDALALVVARGRLMQALPRGAMLAVPLPEERIRPLLGEQLSLAAVNAPALCVVSGPAQPIDELRARLAAEGLDARPLHTSHAFHSAMMDPIVTAFAEQVASIRRHPPRIRWVSNLSGTWITDAEATDPRYWARHLRETVRFSAGVRTLLHEPGWAMLEVGPGRTLSTLVRQQAGMDDRVVLASLRHPRDQHDDYAVTLDALGRLWLAGVPVDWAGFSAHERRLRLPLPTYPFERRRYWIAPRPLDTHTSPDGVIARPPEEADPAAGAPALHPRPEVPSAYAAPRDDVERGIADLWQDLLGIAQVGIYDNFFALGGHSLLATQLLTRLRTRFQVELPLDALFLAPTVEELAVVVVQRRADQADSELLAQMLAELEADLT